MCIASTAALAAILSACNHSACHSFSADQRRIADSTVKSVRGLEALDLIYSQMCDDADLLGQMVALREKGKVLRNESRFAEALATHSAGRDLAESLGDTIELVQALNNIGTDYRRMGILDLAQNYHYKAWLLADDFSDSSFVAKKNRVVSLNGLTNVYLSIGNLNRADSVLRLALAGETALGSFTGQAINCANIGAIFHQRNIPDSAWHYYRRSMDLNMRDGNNLGIALCHTYFGDMYREELNYDRALAEYEQAYAIMKDFSDNWHALNSLIALAGIWNEQGNFAKTKFYLDEGRRVATDIESNEHLADIYRLYSDMYRRIGDYRSALDYRDKSIELKAGLVDMDKVNRIQNTTLALERERQARQMAEANEQLAGEQSMRRLSLIIFIVVVVFMGSLIAMLIHTRHVRLRSHKALADLNKMRESFFTNITHEFRTPLTVILGLSRDLQRDDNPADTDVKDLARTIERQGHRILSLINQLLDISKIRSKVGAPDWRTGCVDAYVAMIVETYTGYARRMGIRLQFIARDRDVNADFVPDYLTKVVSNLLSNALKFTDRHGRVDVTLWAENKVLRIDVADNGKGIAPEHLAHIFEEFYQSDNLADRGGAGSGIGLALVQQIVDSLGGSITVDSVVGRGSTFHVALPLHKSATPYPSPDDDAENAISDYVADSGSQLLPADQPATALPDEVPEPSSAPRVLVVEDNDDIAAYIGSQLKDKYQVSYAADGRRGCDMARELMPDIIITDLMMPVMDGLSLCRTIRADDVTSHIPIIVVTAKVTEAERLEGLRAGADAYLAKPFNSDELITRVDKILEQRAVLSRKFAKELDVLIDQERRTPAKSKDAADKPLISDIDHRFITKVTDCVYMMLNNQKSVDVNAVAERLCMTYGQFNRKLTTLTGFTPAQYIQRIKIKKAQRMLLAHPELGFNDVAEQCGFSDYSNFVRAFKNVSGITPTQFVRQDPTLT